MSRRNNQNNNYNGNQYYGNGQYYGGGNNQYYNQNGQYYNNRNGQYTQNGQYSQNAQYYKQNNKFGIYNQQPQQPKNNNNKLFFIKIGAFVATALLLIILLFGINSCGKKEVNEDAKGPCDEEYKLIGEEPYGYVCVPSDWVRFKDESGNRTYQYSDINANYIITLDVLSKNEISAREYALGYANELKEKQNVEVQGSEVTLGKYNAFQVYGQQKQSNLWVLLYFFEAEDGNVHNIGIEGPDRFNKSFNIPETFILKK